MRPPAFTLLTTWSVGGHRAHASGVLLSHYCRRRGSRAGRRIDDSQRCGASVLFNDMLHLGWVNCSARDFPTLLCERRLHIWQLCKGSVAGLKSLALCAARAQRRESRSRRRRGQAAVLAPLLVTTPQWPTVRSLDEHPCEGP
jgi:hypothetical protein